MRKMWRRCVLGIGCVTLVGMLMAQEKQPQNWSPETLGQLRQLQQAALADDYGYHELAHLTDNIGPRPVGSPQAAAAHR